MTLIPELRADLRTAAARKRPSKHWISRLAGAVRRAPNQRLAISAVVGILSCGGAATAGVLGIESLIGTAPAGTLFSLDPQIWNQYNHNHPPADGVIQSTVKKVATVSVPRVGRLQYWVARTGSGGTCEAFKLPNGVWGGVDPASNRRYNFGGIVPGCDGNSANGTSGFGGGLQIYEDSAGPTPQEDPRSYPIDATRLLFGTAQVPGAVKVRNLFTGQTAPILDGEFFVLEQSYSPRVAALEKSRGIQLQTLNAAGKVLSTSWTMQHTLQEMSHAASEKAPK